MSIATRRGRVLARALVRVLVRVLARVPALLSSLLLLRLLAPAVAQEADPASAPRPAVTVTAKRVLEDPTQFLAADSRVLGRKYASSCNYMSGYNPYDDDIFLDYIQGFHGLTGDVATVRDGAPLGDAQSGPTAGSPLDAGAGPPPQGMEPAVRCGGADLRFAAGRNRIARKDKTLNLALNAYDSGNYPEAMAQFQENYRKLGNAFSALMLGRMALEGQGTPADTAQAVTWLQKVVDGRFGPADRMRFDPRHPQSMSVRAEAAMTLAKIYMVGSGLPRDAVKARDYYEMAADAGYVPAASMLGVAWLSGFAGARDPARGVKYLKQAGEAGYAPALYQLGKAYYNGDGVGKDWQLAGAYFTAGAKEGHPGAQLAAARMYDFGESVAPDPQRALVYYKDAAVQGVPAAQNALATYFYKGEVVAQNLATARKLFNAAAMRAQPDAMYNLAVMTRNGEGGPKDLSMAYVWFSLAKAARYPDADTALADVRPQLSQAELARAEAILTPGDAARTR